MFRTSPAASRVPGSGQQGLRRYDEGPAEQKVGASTHADLAQPRLAALGEKAPGLLNVKGRDCLRKAHAAVRRREPTLGPRKLKNACDSTAWSSSFPKKMELGMGRVV